MCYKKNTIATFLKLILAFLAGFLLWKYALDGLDVITQKYSVDSLWAVVLSRLALLGYLLPFLIWLFLEPQNIYAFRFGNTKSSIRMPCIWYGVKDNVRRVCIVFSIFCLGCAGVLFFVRQISVSVVFAGLVFAVVNSVLEELLWRGYILGRTIQLCGEKFGLILMSLVFGLYHYPLGFSIPICLLFSLGGIYFGGIAIRSKGLLLGTIMHISMNVLFVTLGIIF